MSTRPAGRGTQRNSLGGVPTLFTKIIEGDLPGRFVWRDDRAVAFLSINPLQPGHTLVVPIEEVDHWIDLDADLVNHLMAVSHEIGRVLQERFEPTRVGLMIAGLEVPHTHLHVVPIRGVRPRLRQRRPGPRPGGARRSCRDDPRRSAGRRSPGGRYDVSGGVRIDVESLTKLPPRGVRRSSTRCPSRWLRPKWLRLLAAGQARPRFSMPSREAPRHERHSSGALDGVDLSANLDRFRSVLGYVPQDDIIHPELPLDRTLHYAAMLRLDEDRGGSTRRGGGLTRSRLPPTGQGFLSGR